MNLSGTTKRIERAEARLLDPLLPSSITKQQDKRRARMMLAFFASTVVWAPVYIYFHARYGHLWVAITVAAFSLLGALAPVILHVSGSLRLSGNWLLAQLLGVTVVVSVATGGVVSPVVAWLCITPLSAVLLLGERWGVAWLFLSGLAALCVTFATEQGLIPAQPQDMLGTWFAGTVLLGLVTVASALAILFATTNRRIMSDLNEAREAAERAAGVQGEFLANMSHELKTPLNAIIGFGRLLEAARAEEGAHSDAREYAEHIVAAGEEMSLLIDSLLELRRARSEQESELEAIDLSLLIASVTKGLEMARVGRKQTLELKLSDDLPRVVADPSAIQQVLTNLIENAVKHAGEGAHITVRAFRSTLTEVWVEVEDNGGGISDRAKPHVFTYFERAGAKHAYNMRGAGIGLALTKALVEKQGGEIWVNDAEPQGAVFGISLPTGRAKPNPAA